MCESIYSPYTDWLDAREEEDEDFSIEERAAARRVVTLLEEYLEYWLAMREMNER